MFFKRKIGGGILISALLAVTLSACGSKGTPTPSPEMLYTQAAQTAAAAITQTAALMPTATSTPTTKPTTTPEPTLMTTATSTGATSTPVTLVSPTRSTGPDKAVWVAQTPGDGTVFTPGEDFTLVWTVKNTGTTTWNTEYQLRFYLNDPALRFTASDIKVPKEVKPNESVDLSLWMEAPHEPGDYTTIWVLTNDQGANFYPLTFSLKVAGTAPVEVPSATPTP